MHNYVNIGRKNTLAKYLVGKDLDILDVACGTGVTGEYLHKLWLYED